MHLNTQCIRNKLTDLDIITSEKQIDFFCVTEHWLKNCEIENYRLKNFYNASSYSREQNKGGGVGIYVKDNIHCVPLNMVKNQSVECVCEMCAVYVKTLNIVLLCVYRPPYYNNYNDFYDIITRTIGMCKAKYKSAAFIIAGDFNIDFLKSSSRCEKIKDLFKTFNLKLQINEPTRYENVVGTCIDNIFTDILEPKACIYNANVSDHQNTQLLEFTILSDDSQTRPPSQTLKRNYTKNNEINFIEHIRNTLWNDVCSVGTAEEKFSSFFEELEYAYKIHFPYMATQKDVCNNVKKATGKWYDQELQSMRSELHSITELAKTSSDPVLCQKRISLRKQYRNLIKQKQLEHNMTLLSKSTNKPRAIWSIIRKQMGKSEHKHKGSKDITANDFNNFFKNISTDLVNNLSKYNTKGDSLLDIRVDIRGAACSSNRYYLKMYVRP